MFLSVIMIPCSALFLSTDNPSFSQTDFPVLKGPYLGQPPPGKTPRLFAPGIISTCDLHSSVYFSPDGKEAYFSRLSKTPGISGIYGIREERGKWTRPKFVLDARDRGLTPYLSPDGQTLFCSIADQLYYLNRTPSGWSESKNLGEVINFQRRQDGPSVSRKGTLFYSAMFGKKDGMYRAEFRNGSYAPPEKLDIRVEGNSLLGYPVVAPDESYILFFSWTEKTGFGMQDLYITFQKEDRTWGTPINLGDSINTQHSESFPFVTRDGKYLFFNSNRPSPLNPKRMGQFFGNIYWVDAGFIEDMRRQVLMR